MRRRIIRGYDSFLCKVNGERATMDTETEKKLTEQQHQIEMLRTDMEANMKTMKAESDSALSKNAAAIERLRTTIEGNSRTLLMQMILVVGVGVGILALILR